MFLNCSVDIKILSKYPKTASNGKTYFHLIVSDVAGGEVTDLGCTEDVFSYVKENKCYMGCFTINPFYLRKDYSTNIIINSVKEFNGKC